MCTSSPSARSSRPNTSRLSARCDTREEAGEAFAANGVDVVLGLEHDAERLLDRRWVQSLPIQRNERPDPVQRLRDSRNLVQLKTAQILNDRRHLLGEARGCFWHALPYDGELFLERRVFNPLIQAAALQRVVHFTRAVGCEDDERWRGGANRAELRDGDLEFGKQFKKIALELFVGAVDFVDEEHRRTRARRIDRLQQRPFDEERLAV